MEKLFSVVLAVLWCIAVAYVLVSVVSAIVKGVRKLKSRKKGEVNDGIGNVGTDAITVGADSNEADGRFDIDQ